MKDLSLIVNVQGFILHQDIPREISWIHMKSAIGETMNVFTPNYELDELERTIVHEFTEKKHGLRFKRTPGATGLWINNETIKDYFKQLHDLYGGTFGIKGGVLTQHTFDSWQIPTRILEGEKCINVLGNGCSMYKCRFYYERELKKNNSE